MWKSIKKGFGFGIGYILAGGLIGAIAKILKEELEKSKSEKEENPEE